MAKKIKIISSVTGVSIPYITKILNDRNIYRNKLDFFKDEIVKFYVDGFSASQISKILNIPKTNIYRRLHYNNTKIRTISESKRDKDIIHDIFNRYTSENCYWGGVMAADGCVSKDGTIILSLKNSDICHISKFISFINCKKLIKSYNGMSFIRFGSKEMREDLSNNFNIVHRKTHILKPPQNLSENLSRNFIRGYIDGDGCLVNSAHKYTVSLAGTKCILSWVKCIFQQYINNIGDPSILPMEKNNPKTHLLAFNGKSQSSIIAQWLYEESTSQTRLERKYKIAKSKYGVI